MKWLPNALTIARCLLAVVVAGLILRLGAPEPPEMMAIAAFLLFCVVALTDFLDGYLARRLDAVSALGAFLDPIADKLLVAFCLFAYCAMSNWPLSLLVPTLLIVSRDIGVTLARLQPGRTIPVSRLAKMKTALELAGVGGLLLATMLSHDFGGIGGAALKRVSVLAIWAAAALSLWTGLQYFKRS